MINDIMLCYCMSVWHYDCRFEVLLFHLYVIWYFICGENINTRADVRHTLFCSNIHTNLMSMTMPYLGRVPSPGWNGACSFISQSGRGEGGLRMGEGNRSQLPHALSLPTVQTCFRLSDYNYYDYLLVYYHWLEDFLLLCIKLAVCTVLHRYDLWLSRGETAWASACRMCACVCERRVSAEPVAEARGSR